MGGRADGLSWVAYGLGLYLTFVEPVRFALVAAAALTRLLDYGAPALTLLGFRVLITGFGVFAGRALRRNGDTGPARVFLLASAVAVVLTFATPYFPGNRLPGLKWPTLAAWLAAHAVALGLLQRLARRAPATPR